MDDRAKDALGVYIDEELARLLEQDPSLQIEKFANVKTCAQKLLDDHQKTIANAGSGAGEEEQNLDETIHSDGEHHQATENESGTHGIDAPGLPDDGSPARPLTRSAAGNNQGSLKISKALQFIFGASSS